MPPMSTRIDFSLDDGSAHVSGHTPPSSLLQLFLMAVDTLEAVWVLRALTLHGALQVDTSRYRPCRLVSTFAG